MIRTLEKYKNGEVPFTLILEDISGNSFMENPFAPDADPAMKVEHFERTRLQDMKLNIAAPDENENLVEGGNEEEASTKGIFFSMCIHVLPILGKFSTKKLRRLLRLLRKLRIQKI